MDEWSFLLRKNLLRACLDDLRIIIPGAEHPEEAILREGKSKNLQRYAGRIPLLHI